MLGDAGWLVQDRQGLNLYAARGVVVREVSLKPGHGEADYLFFVDGEAVGAIEAKKEGATLIGVEVQSQRYGDGLPDQFAAPVRPLPFLYESTGSETRFTNRLDPEPRSRRVFAFHRPETLQAWAYERALGTGGRVAAEGPVAYDSHHTLRARLREMPPLAEQQRIVAELERRLSGIERMEAAIANELRRAERAAAPAKPKRGRGKGATQLPL